MKRTEALDSVIVGAGLAGTVVAASLAKTAPPSFRAMIFDAASPGPGTAYAPGSDRLLMNGPARAMSAVPEDPADLVRWLGPESDDRLIPRKLFGRYLAEQFDRALAAHPGIALSRNRIVDIERRGRGYVARDDAGQEFSAGSVVLALGNHEPNDAFLPRAVRADAGYVRDPWHFDASVLRGSAIALVGSGLTAMDIVALLEERGYDGAIHIISRRGLLPAVENVRARGLDPATLALDTGTPLSLLHTMRAAAAAREARGGDWREVAESIRKISPAIWEGWSGRQQRQFLEHLHSFWTAHRYRVPPQTAQAFERLRARNAIVRHRGRISAAHRERERLVVRIVNAEGTSAIGVTDIVNCTGPNGDYERSGDPLVVNLMRRGLLLADELHLGIEVSQDLRVLDRSGHAQPSMYALGPPTRGRWYETTAVPEIREQARRIAKCLITEHGIGALEAVS